MITDSPYGVIIWPPMKSLTYKPCDEMLPPPSIELVEAHAEADQTTINAIVLDLAGKLVTW